MEIKQSQICTKENCKHLRGSCTSQYHIIERDDVQKMMKYNIQEFFKNPHSFDYPPPIFETPEEQGWTVLARAIIIDDKKYIMYAKRWKEKEIEWKKPHFIKPYIKTEQPVIKKGKGEISPAYKSAASSPEETFSIKPEIMNINFAGCFESNPDFGSTLSMATQGDVVLYKNLSNGKNNCEVLKKRK